MTGRIIMRSALLRASAIGLAFVIASGLFGCANYQGIGSDMEILSADKVAHIDSLNSYASAGAEWPDQQWWRDFKDPQLTQIIEEALNNNPSMDEAAARVRLAAARLEANQSYLLPQTDFSGDITGQHYSVNGMTPAPYAGSFQKSGDLELEAGYQLDFWGRNRAAVAASRSRLAAAKAEAADARLLLADAVAKTYFELAQWQAIRAVAVRALEQRQHIVELTRQRVNAGLDNRVALRQAETQVPLTRALLAQVDEMIEITQHGLSALMASGPDRVRNLDGIRAELPGGNLQLPENLPMTLLGHRPDLVAARWQVEASLQSIDAGKAEFYPDINLRVFAGLSSIGLDNLAEGSSRTYGIGPALTLPIFDGGRLRASLKADYARFDRAVAIYNQRLIGALQDVADQMSHHRALIPQTVQQQLALDHAENALELAFERYQAGLGTYLSVLNAESVVIQQRLYRIQLKQRALAVQVDLIRALGGGFAPEAVVDSMNAHNSEKPSVKQQSRKEKGEESSLSLSHIGVNHD